MKAYLIELIGEVPYGQVCALLIGAVSEEEAREIANNETWSTRFSDLDYTKLESLNETETPGILATFYA